MTQTKEEKAAATKIRKWLKTAQETKTETRYFGLKITRLTSLKSLCKDDETSAEKFAIFIAQQVSQKMNAISRPEHFSVEEWDSDKALMAEGLSQMESYAQSPSVEAKQALKGLLREIESKQGDDIRRVHWTTVHFVRSGYLLQLEYAVRCFTEYDFPYWVYKLGANYVQKGDGINSESVPRLLDVAEFWCQYYFSQSLTEKFPKIDLSEFLEN